MKRTCLVTALLLLAPVGQPLLSRPASAQIAEADIPAENQPTTTTSALSDLTSDCPYGICHAMADAPHQESSLTGEDSASAEAIEETVAVDEPYDPYAHDPYAHQNYGYWYRHHNDEAASSSEDQYDYDAYDYNEDYAADPSEQEVAEEDSPGTHRAYSSAQEAENATEQSDLANSSHDDEQYGEDQYGYDSEDYGSYEDEYDAYNYDDEYQADSYDYEDQYQTESEYENDYESESQAESYDYDEQQAETDYAYDEYSDDETYDDADYGEDYSAETQSNDEGDYEYDNYQYESEYSYGADHPAAVDEVTLEEQKESDLEAEVATNDDVEGYQEPYPYDDQSTYGYGSELYDYDCDEAYWDEMNREDSAAEVAGVSSTTIDMEAAAAEQHEQERELGYGYDNDPYHYAETPLAEDAGDQSVADHQNEHLYEDAYDDIYNDSDLYGYEYDYQGDSIPAQSSDSEVEAEGGKDAEVETATDPEADQYQDLTHHGELDEYGWDDDAAYYDEFGYGYVPAKSGTLAERFPTVAHLIEQLASTDAVRSTLAWNRALYYHTGELVQGVRGLQDRVRAEAIARSDDAELEDLFSDPVVEAERQMMRKMARSLESTGSVLQGFSRRLIQMAEEGQVETATYRSWPAMER